MMLKNFFLNKYLIDFFASLMFFTRIPINWSYFSDEAPDLTRAAWSFPLVGFIVGALSGSIGEIFILINIPTFLSCSIAIAFSLLITGAFHEDGLADMADGFGAGGSSQKINKIMHDSRLGTYGTSALILGLLIRIGLVSYLVDLGFTLFIILGVAFSTGKLSIILMRNLYNISSLAKIGSIIDPISNNKIFIAALIWLIPAVCFFSFFAIIWSLFLVLIVVFIIGNKSKRKLGGITGDVLGATAFITELTFLLGLITYISVNI